jgi:hypothetical protein
VAQPDLRDQLPPGEACWRMKLSHSTQLHGHRVILRRTPMATLGWASVRGARVGCTG